MACLGIRSFHVVTSLTGVLASLTCAIPVPALAVLALVVAFVNLHGANPWEREKAVQVVSRQGLSVVPALGADRQRWPAGAWRSRHRTAG